MFSNLAFIEDLLNMDMKSSVNNVEYSYPPNRILKTDKSYVLELALAGWNKEDIKVSIADDKLKVSGSHKKGKNKYTILSSTMAFRDFNVVFDIVAGKFDIKNVKVTFKNGLLAVVLPISEDAKPLTFTVE